MYRIALFHNLPAGGAKRVVHDQVRELTRRGHQVHEFTLSTADLVTLPLTDFVVGTTVLELDWRDLQPFPVRGMGPFVHLLQNKANLSRLSICSSHLADLVDPQSYDFAFVHDCRFIVAPFLLRYLRVPSLFYLHSYLFRAAEDTENLEARHRLLPVQWAIDAHSLLVHETFATNLKSATHVLTNSRYMQRLIWERHQVSASVIYPGIDIATFSPQAIDSNRRYVLSVGNLLPSKGHEFVIESLTLIPREIRPALIVVTPNPDPVFETHLRELAAQGCVQVEMHCALSPLAMASLYSGAIALTFAPAGEPLGLVALESMACGTPVIGVRDGGLVDTIQDGVTGYLVNRDVRSFAGALERIISDESLRDRFGTNARRFVEESWTWDRATDELELQFSAAMN